MKYIQLFSNVCIVQLCSNGGAQPLNLFDVLLQFFIVRGDDLGRSVDVDGVRVRPRIGEVVQAKVSLSFCSK